MFCETVTRTLFLSLLCFWIKITTADLSQRPRDGVAVVGLSTFLNCSTTTNEIHWFHYPDGDDKQRYLVYGYNKTYSPYEGRFRVETDATKGAYNLVIASVQLKDFGKYQCQDDFGKGTEQSVQLTVLESQPSCGSSMKPGGVIGPNRCHIPPENLHLSCSVTFRGRTPSIDWFKDGNEVVITEGVTRNISANHVTLSLSLEPNSIVDGDAFQCRATDSAAEKCGCTPEAVKVNNGSNVWFYVLSALLGAAVFLWLVFFGFCLKLSIERRKRESNSSDYEKHELHPLANNRWNEDDPKQLKADNVRLTEKVADLEEKLYCKGRIDYLTTPKVVHTTPTERSKTAIRGIAILNGELFAVFERSPDIEVFDPVTFVSKQSFKGVESSNVEGLLWNPQDIAASKVNACLYIIHQKQKDQKTEIWKVEAAKRTKALHWSLECRIGRLSTHEHSVIVCAVEDKRINEYSLNGDLLHSVSLSPADGFDHLWHSIKVTGEHFLISNQDENKRHQICLVDSKAKIVGRTADPKMLRIHTPICLTEDKDRSILVLNAKKKDNSKNNNSITVLSSDLIYSRKTLDLSAEGYCMRICLGENGSLLFVAVNDGDPSNEIWHSGRIVVYSIGPTVKPT